MPKKPKFKPEITRVKLNPEQAVLACACYDSRNAYGGVAPTSRASTSVCNYSVPSRTKTTQTLWGSDATIS